MSVATADRGTLSDRLSIGLLVLTMVSGIVDAVSFLGLGHVFTANMTGNVAFLAFAVAGVPAISVARSMTSLAAFMSGALLGGYFGRGVAGPCRRRWLLLCATCEASLLVAAAIAAIAIDGDRTALVDREYALIVLMALAMGLRNATVQQLAVPGLTTPTVLTTTITGLVADFALPGGHTPRVWRRLGSIASLFAGAAIGVLLLRFGLAVPLIVGAFCVLVSTIGYTELAPAHIALDRLVEQRVPGRDRGARRRLVSRERRAYRSRAAARAKPRTESLRHRSQQRRFTQHPEGKHE